MFVLACSYSPLRGAEGAWFVMVAVMMPRTHLLEENMCVLWQDDAHSFQNLLNRWRAAHSTKEARNGGGGGGGDGAAGQSQNLFLIPSGIPGVNDHTLYEPVDVVS